MEKQILVISDKKSDFSNLLEQVCKIKLISAKEICEYNLDEFSALCILGGNNKEPLIFDAKSRIKIEEQIAKGKKVFCEYALSIGMVYSKEPSSTRFSRLICVSSNILGLDDGDILDEQCNDFLSPHFSKKGSSPLLTYKESIAEHSNTQLTSEEKSDIHKWAIWNEEENLILCSFRICNFIKARFAPIKRWNSLIKYIIAFITEEDTQNLKIISEYSLNQNNYNDCNDFFANAINSLSCAVNWFKKADMLIENGKGGVYEGFCTEVYPNGTQRLAYPIRTDCAGEVSMAFMSDYLVNGNEESLIISNNLESFCYDTMQIKDGIFKGMLRWTNIAWEVCYQDDMARVIIPSLLKIIYLNDNTHLESICSALDFLVKTTGKNGLRPARTDNLVLDENKIKEIKETDCDMPSAHYNAFYLACLCICGKITNNQNYIDIAIKGLSSIMAVYPKTRREQSETEELCRLILPLSWLYWATQNEEHKKWLYMVTKDLQKMHHKSGAYLEWDSDYSADCSKQEGGECSLLTKNGDPIVDLLYSVNWLPIGFIQAYLVTKDEWFYDLWKDVSSFLISSQIVSDNSQISGAWARGFDVDFMEVYGLPNDVGWGPWAIETGWTVAEIASGIGLGTICEQLKKFY